MLRFSRLFKKCKVDPLENEPSRTMRKILIPLAAFLGLLASGFFSPQARGAEIDSQQIVTVLPKDAIPAILDPRGMLVNAREADRELDDQEDVMGVSIQGESRAYPVVMLSRHEIVNDVVGGVPLAVTW